MGEKQKPIANEATQPQVIQQSRSSSDNAQNAFNPSSQLPFPIASSIFHHVVPSALP